MSNTENTPVTLSDITSARIRVRIALDAYEAAWTKDAFGPGAQDENRALIEAERVAADLAARFSAQQRAL